MSKRQAKDKAWEIILAHIWAEVSKPSDIYDTDSWADHEKVYEQMNLIYNQLVERHGKR